jgi:hypothetical protein
MYALLFLIIFTAVSAQTRKNARFPGTQPGKTTCSDQTARKDLWAGRYVNGPKNGQTFPPQKDVYSEAECFNRCNAEPDCAEFTWYSGPCNLFLSGTTMCNQMQGGGTGYFNGMFTAISENGYRTCSDSTCRKDLSAGRWYNCNDGSAFGAPTTVPDVQTCASNCLATPGCRYFTFYFGGACNLFVTNGGVCAEGSSQSAGSWYRFGSSNAVSPLEEESSTVLESEWNTVLESEWNTVLESEWNTAFSGKDEHHNVIAGLSVGLGVAGFLVLALSGVVIALLVKWGKLNKASDDNVAQLL